MTTPSVAWWPIATPPLPWAVERIRAARAIGPIPLYGSDEWAARPPRDPRRWAAVICAAEAWRDHCSAERVALDLAAEDRAVIARLKAASVDVSLAADWTSIASSPSHAELVARRAS